MLGGQFNGGRMVMLQRWSLYWRQNGHVMKVTSFNEGEWLCYRGSLFNGGGMVLTKVASLKEGEGRYRRGQFNRGKIVMLQRWLV